MSSSLWYANRALILCTTLLCVAVALPGCSGDEDEPTPTLPPDATTPTPTATPFGPGDDDIDPPDPAPQHTLLMEDVGLWLLSPTGGPYDALDSESSLQYTETLDGSETPSCALEFSLRGELASTSSASGCPACDVVFDVQFTLLEGDPEACRGVELPRDGEVRVLGYSSDREYIFFNYYGTGQWLPWYDAFGDDLDPDRIFFTWSREVGVEADND